jgi:hypothetical protein
MKSLIAISFGFILPIFSFAQLTDLQLITQADTIKNETRGGANTANRIGRMFENIIYNKVNKLYFIDSTKIPYLAKNNNFTGAVDSFQSIVVGGQTINQNGGFYTKGKTSILGDWATKDNGTTVSINDSTRVVSVNTSTLNLNTDTTSISGFLGLNAGNNIYGFMPDTTLNTGGNPTAYVPTQSAVKAYVANHQAGGNSYDKHYYDYRVRLYQSGTTAPSVQKEFVNEIDSANEYSGGTRTEYLRIGVGQYSLTIFSVQNKFNLIGYNTDISFSDRKITNGSYLNGSNGNIYYNTFYFNTYDSSNTLADGIITFTNLYIRVYY